MNRPQCGLSDAKILLVDDTPANLRLLRQTLESEGYSIMVASNGETAFRLARNVRPDLILLDVQMPGLDGFETCVRLKGEDATRDIPVIFVTARAETESVVKGFQAGGVDYIVKPFQTEEVLARVRTHLRIDRLARDLEASNRGLLAANRQIHEATGRKSRFLANMSHELRSPMNAILGFTGLVLSNTEGILPEPQRDNLMKVKISADRLLMLINDILDLSKVEAGRLDIQPSTFRVGGLIALCCETLRPLVKPGVTLRHEIPEEIGEAHTDASRLQQILTNLLSNALNFTESGEVRVAVKRHTANGRRETHRPSPPAPLPLGGEEGGGSRSDRLGGASHESRTTDHEFLEIAVSDTGIGIPADAMDYIFEEFRQVPGSPGRHKGTGLGLAITKGLTELLGGTISVESEVGKGSVFTVRVPMVYMAT